MAEDNGDKTEAPTPRRRQEAREQGNIARSPDVNVALILLGVLIMLKNMGPKLVDALKSLVQDMLGAQSLSDFNAASVSSVGVRAIYLVGAAIVPLLLGVVVIAIAGNLVQVGIYFGPQRLQPNLAALNPIGGIGKLFNTKTPIQLGISLLKMVMLSLVAYSAIHKQLQDILAVQGLDFVQIFGLGATLVYSVTLRVGIAMLVLAIADYFYQRWRIEQELKMSKQDIKDEMRRMDGDPKIKMRRRQIAIQQMKKRLKKDVPTADVVVTNPTEFAVALKYEKNTMHAPRVIAKGQGLIAAQIRQIAIESGVPILERKPLARALYKLVEVGQEIPEQFYSAVAEILAYVYELTRKTGRMPIGVPA